MTGSGWPGIMFVIGLAIGADRAFQEKYLQGSTVFAFFSAIPILSAVAMLWNIFGPFILIPLTQWL